MMTLKAAKIATGNKIVLIFFLKKVKSINNIPDKIEE